MCVQDEEPVDLPVRRITRSVAANAPKLPLPSLHGTEQKMSTPNRKMGTESLFCWPFHADCDVNLMLTGYFPPCLVCISVANDKAKSERRWVGAHRPLFLVIYLFFLSASSDFQREPLCRSSQSTKRKAPDTAEESPTKRFSPPKKSQSVRPFNVKWRCFEMTVCLRRLSIFLIITIQAIRPNMRSFLHTVQKNQMLMMTPNTLGRAGVIKSFIKHTTPLRIDPKVCHVVTAGSVNWFCTGRAAVFTQRSTDGTVRENDVFFYQLLWRGVLLWILSPTVERWRSGECYWSTVTGCSNTSHTASSNPFL